MIATSPDALEWVFLLTRAVIFLAATYMGLNLLIAFIKNHYAHKPKRWLVGWQGLAFAGVGLDGLLRLWSRAFVIFYGQAMDVTTWPFLLTATITAIGCAGTLVTWLRWPTSRVVGATQARHGKNP